MITINIDKAKAIAHGMRRTARATEFAPFDDIIAKRLPGEAEAEASRQAIRIKYAEIQNKIDAAADVAALKEVM